MRSRYAEAPDVHLPEPEAHAAAPVVLWVVMGMLNGVPALVVVVILAAAERHLAFLGWLFVALGHFWLAGLIIRHCPLRAALYTIFLPIFTTRFALHRWDVARWPFVIRTAGIVVTVAALCAGG